MAAPPTKEGKQPPKLRLRTESGTARVLRSILFQHNLRVAVLAALTLIAAMAAWTLLYTGFSWAFVFAIAVFDPTRDSLPRDFGIVFVVAGACAVAYAWVDQRLTPNARPRDETGIGEVMTDVILLVPNITLAVAHTIRAWQCLTRTELAQAAALLHRLEEEKHVPMSGIRLQIPDPTSAMRVLFALQVTEIVELHRKENEFWLRLNALRPAALRSAHGNPAGA